MEQSFYFKVDIRQHKDKNVSFVQDTIEGNIKEFMYLVGKVHSDDEDAQRYITERIYVDRNSG